jgi:alpha-tubulin suppressor-like RCC1 family protein
MDNRTQKLVRTFCLGLLCCLPNWTFAGGISAVAARGFNSAFIKSDGSLWTFGQNSCGECGNGTYDPANVPRKIVESGVTAVAFGGAHTLFLKSDGSLWGMGLNFSGQLGMPYPYSAPAGINQTNTPQLIVAGGVTKIFAGGNTTFFITQDGSLWGMGLNWAGEMANGTFEMFAPMKKLQITNVVAVAGGDYFTAFLKSDGSLWGTGNNADGQIGAGTLRSETNTPQLVVAANVAAVSAVGYSTMFRKADGTAWGLGDNSYRFFGNGFDDPYQFSAPSPCALTNLQSTALGGEHALFLANDGSLWGSGLCQSFGINLNVTTNAPCKTLLGGVRDCAAGALHSLVVKTDGSLWATGANYYGQLGDGTLDNHFDWVQIVPPSISTPAVLNGLSISNNTATIIAFGTSEESYELQFSTKLTEWTSNQTLTAQPNGSLQFTDVLPAGSTVRYYRCRSL